jgi:antitoxin (DNA-binding transcriptional repressor) of toxin-antitoxin stability system
MRKASVRDLHIRTSELIRDAAAGVVIVIERRGEPVAELRPLLDAAYVAKYYLNEPDSPRVRKNHPGRRLVDSSAWSIAEVSCIFHRYLSQGDLSAKQFHLLLREFLAHVDSELWTIVPVTAALIRRVTSRLAALPPEVFLRAGDAVQLVSALEAGEPEVCTNDRHMLAAALHFGLVGRTA